MCLIDLRVVFADFSWSSGGGASCRSFPFMKDRNEVIARARKMGSMGFAMETLPVPGCPGTSGLPRPPLQAEVCRAGGQSPRMTMRDR